MDKSRKANLVMGRRRISTRAPQKSIQFIPCSHASSPQEGAKEMEYIQFHAEKVVQRTLVSVCPEE